jgi:hypothetical protein
VPEYLSPGVYIKEVDSGPRPIEGVGTAMAAFIGFAAYSAPEDTNRPILVTNWSQYLERFGRLDAATGQRQPHVPGKFLSHAVYGYFLNGGGRCYVTNVVPQNGAKPEPTPPLQIPAAASNAVPALTLAHKAEPAPDVTIEIGPPSGEDAGEGAFTLRIQSGNNSPEEYPNVTVTRRGGKSVMEAVNARSTLVQVLDVQNSGSIAERAPAVGSYLLAASATATLASVEPAALVGNAAERTGVEGMEIADDVTMVACPDLMSAYLSGALNDDGVKAVQLAMINHCERLGDRMAILDPIPELNPQAAQKWREKTNYDSKFAALYYPWIKVMGPEGKPIAIPPCGHIAGVYARNDNTRGVHKAPANEIVMGALDAAMEITKGEQDVLNPLGVNCIRSFTGRGLRVWGARTLSSDPAWRYVSVRRLFNYIEKSIERGTQWVVFEPNDPNLWARVRRDVSAFLTGVWREGMLFGLTPAEAFYVKCDAELNPSDVRDRGQLIIEVGLAPVKPAEFVIFRFSQWADGGA